MRHFGRNLNVIWKLCEALIIISSLLWKILYYLEQFFIVVNDQILKYNIHLVTLYPTVLANNGLSLQQSTGS